MSSSPSTGRLKRRTAAEKAEHAIGLRNHGMSLAETARQTGYSNAASCNRAITRYLAAHPAPSVEEMRRVENMKYDMIEAGLWQILGTTHWLTCSRGLVTTDEGLPIPDHGPRVQAYRALTQLYQRRARLNGLDAPVRVTFSADEDLYNDPEINAIIASLQQAVQPRATIALPPGGSEGQDQAPALPPGGSLG